MGVGAEAFRREVVDVPRAAVESAALVAAGAYRLVRVVDQRRFDRLEPGQESRACGLVGLRRQIGRSVDVAGVGGGRGAV
ncbi:hypothetical protein [Streptomyces sp. NPDC008139]|uniref:hypothetical protein n=1 Tax=Streptomyces sp. NPDC008139 TaxID=3364814 RepID=UPI0036EB3599